MEGRVWQRRLVVQQEETKNEGERQVFILARKQATYPTERDIAKVPPMG